MLYIYWNDIHVNDKMICCIYTMFVILLYFVDDTCFPQHERIRCRRQLRLQVNYTTPSTIKPEIETGSLEMNWRGVNQNF